MSMKEDRAREGKKARYRKMGFGPAMDRGDIDFKDKHPLTKKRLKNFKKKDDSPMSDERFYQQRKAQINKAGVSTKKMLTGGQAKIAAKAPPPNKLDEKDFAVLRAEKAKGRGMGLQDESVQPGKVMKANKGKSAMVPLKKGYSKTLGVFPTINKVKPSVGGGSGMGKGTDKVSTKKAEDFMKRRKQLGGAGKIISATKIGKMLLPVVGAGVAAQQYLKSKMKNKNKNKEPEQKMGGGMMKRYSKGGGADSGRIGEMKSRLAVAADKVDGFRKARGKDTDRLTQKDIEFIKEKMKPKGKMGGGMIAPSQRPGYSKGTMVKARGCKLGRTRPTKIT